MSLEEDSQQEDVFDLLPDALVLEIFNRVQDARSLSACMTLCKRFGDLVPQTDNVCLTISRRKKMPESAKANCHTNKLKGFIVRDIFKPIHTFLHRMVARKPKACSHCDDDDEESSFRLPNDMLKNFKEIRSLALKLPGHDGDISPENGSGALLKWKAEFGKELESCVVLGATGFHESAANQKNDDKESIKDDEITAAARSANLTNKQLKRRVVWTISCLIASSARHHMLKQIISSNRMIRDVEISDGSKQGMIRMTERQVADLRKEMDSTEATAAAVVEPEYEMERTKVPAVKIKMWYVPVLELPESGCVMKGATLAVIRPVVAAENGSEAAVVEKDDDVSLAMGAFGEKWLGEAVRKLVRKKRAYTLEMNSF